MRCHGDRRARVLIGESVRLSSVNWQRFSRVYYGTAFAAVSLLQGMFSTLLGAYSNFKWTSFFKESYTGRTVCYASTFRVVIYRHT
jgi:hypothetical protein